MTFRRRTIIESPYAGAIDINVAYARKAVRHSLELGEAPIASHLLHTQPGILRDEVPDERTWGIEAGLAWYEVADLVAFYCDHGISNGMQKALQRVAEYGLKFEIRYILEPRDRVSTTPFSDYLYSDESPPIKPMVDPNAPTLRDVSLGAARVGPNGELRWK